MQVQHSLRFRIIVAFGVFGVVLGAVYGAIVIGGLHLVEDNTFFHRMYLEAGLFQKQYANNADAQLPHTRYLKGYVGANNLPAILPDELRRALPGEYTLEVEYKTVETEYYILVSTLPHSSLYFYLIYDVTDLEPLEYIDPMLITILLVAMFLVTALGIWLGIMTSKSIIAPLVRLAQQTEEISPENIPKNFSANYYHDEVGTVALTLEKLLLRTQAFIEREQHFTRNASHELRTPVTIIKGASELLDSLPQAHTPELQRPLQRISRAVFSMENIIETFLHLAREDLSLSHDSQCCLYDVLKHSIAQHQHLLEHKSVEVELDITPDLKLPVPSALVSILCANLISNAFNYTDTGKIHIYAQDNGFCVEDTGIGIEPDLLNEITQAFIRGKKGQGYGLGLNITHNICLRLGWILNINSVVEQGTCACIYFKQAV